LEKYSNSAPQKIKTTMRVTLLFALRLRELTWSSRLEERANFTLPALRGLANCPQRSERSREMMPPADLTDYTECKKNSVEEKRKKYSNYLQKTALRRRGHKTTMMRVTLLFALCVSASGLKLTPENFDSLTAGKSVRNSVGFFNSS
jgi:hypothetical protein